MHEFGRTELFFGTYGLPDWDGEWRFPRQCRRERYIRALEPARQVLAPAIPASLDDEQEDVLEKPALAVARNVRRFTLENPEIDLGFPASVIRDESEIEGPAAKDWARLLRRENELPKEHTRGRQLVAYGFAISRFTSSLHKPRIPVVVSTAGAGGAVLRMALEHREQMSCGRDASIDYWTPLEDEVGWWMGKDSPIKQLLFAPNSDLTTTNYLAVRYADTVLILRILLRAYRTQCSPFKDAVLPASRFDVHILAVLDCPAIITDVTFNPWNQQQLALVNSQARLCHWTFSKPHGTQLKEASKKQCLLDTVLGPFTRVLFINHDTWLLMGPKRLSQTNGSELIDISLDEEEMFLDMIQGTSHAEHIFVLTTVRVYWLRTKLARVEVVLSWRLYTISEARELQMSVVELAEKQSESCTIRTLSPGADIAIFNLVLYSLQECCVYEFEFDHELDRGVSTEDPRMLRFEGPKAIMLSLHLRPCINTFADVRLLQLNVVYEDFSLWQLFLGQGSLEVIEGLFCAQESRRIIDRRLSRKSTQMVVDDFVVSDHESDDDLPIATLVPPKSSRFGYLNVESVVGELLIRQPGPSLESLESIQPVAGKTLLDYSSPSSHPVDGKAWTSLQNRLGVLFPIFGDAFSDLVGTGLDIDTTFERLTRDLHDAPADLHHGMRENARYLAAQFCLSSHTLQPEHPRLTRVEDSPLIAEAQNILDQWNLEGSASDYHWSAHRQIEQAAPRRTSTVSRLDPPPITSSQVAASQVSLPSQARKRGGKRIPGFS